MADLTNEQTAERLEAVRGYLAKIAEAFLLGQSATLLRDYGPANDGDAAQVFGEAAEAAEAAAARLRKPLQFRWEQHDKDGFFFNAMVGDMVMGSIQQIGLTRWQWSRIEG